MNLFSERGFDRTTVDEIANQASVGKGTIYLYFENKEQIFLAIIEEGLNEFNQKLSEAISQSTDYLHGFEVMILTQFQFIETHSEFYRIFSKERLSLRLCTDDRARSRIHVIHQRMQQIMSDYIYTGMRQGYLRQGDPNEFAWAVSGIITHFAFHWIMEGGVGSLVAKKATVLELVLNGVKKV